MSKKINQSGITLMPEFNLSQLYENAQHKSICTPTEFINSPDCKALLLELTGQSEPHHFTMYIHVPAKHYYTHSRWLFLAYIRHCFGNDLTQAINHELAA